MAVAKQYAKSKGLNANRVVFLGASLSIRAVTDSPFDQAVLDANQIVMNSLGFTGTLASRAVSGSTGDAILTQIAAEVAEFGHDLRDNLYIIDFGGNDVSLTRPGAGTDFTDLADDLTAIRLALTEARMPYVLLPITRRNYPAPDAVLPNDVDTLGSLPYNTAVIDPFLATWADDMFSNVVSNDYVLDMYRSSFKAPGFISSDGVHWQFDQDANFAWMVLAKLADWFQGKHKETNSGKSFMLQCSGTGHDMTTRSYTPTGATDPIHANRINRALGFLVDLNGERIPRMNAAFVQFATTGSSGTAAASARIADTRFHDPSVVTTAGVLMAFHNWTLTTQFQLDINGFIPGQTGTITAVAARDATTASGSRQSTIRVNGADAKVLDAANDAVSNQQSWDFTADADGHVRMDCTDVPANGYLSAIIVDID